MVRQASVIQIFLGFEKRENSVRFSGIFIVVLFQDMAKKPKLKSYIIKWLLIISPFLLCLFGTMACLVPYYITVYYANNFNYQRLNFISLYTNYKPSSGLFSLFITLSTYFLLIISLFKYLSIMGLNNVSKVYLVLNNLSFSTAILSVLNAIVLQSFHLYISKSIHVFCGLIFLITILVYLWTQTILTFVYQINNVYKKYEHFLIIFLIRFLIVLSSTILFALYLLLANPLLQWLCVFMIFTFFFTFIHDFVQFNFNLNARLIATNAVVINQINSFNVIQDDFDAQYNAEFVDQYRNGSMQYGHEQPHIKTSTSFTTYV
jgi:hypothetical protein